MSTVTVSLMGGLGNQLFQIFTTLAYAREHNCSIQFQNCKTLTCGQPRPTYWNTLFNVLQPFLVSKESLKSFKVLAEKSFPYTKLPAPGDNKHIRLLGYFQSPLYFRKHLIPILALLEFKEKREELRQQLKWFSDNKIRISMHFRISGYIDLPDHHPVQDLAYYQKALTEITNIETQPVEVIVFRQPEDVDRVDSSISILKEKFPGVIFSYAPSNLEDWQEMICISLCDSHIIANSTFSWWGAYLSQVLETRTDEGEVRVLYPKNWFGPKIGHSIVDLIPLDWIGL
jgi:hypothetical protein